VKVDAFELLIFSFSIEVHRGHEGRGRRSQAFSGRLELLSNGVIAALLRRHKVKMRKLLLEGVR
jgi:hypothetical protein